MPTGAVPRFLYDSPIRAAEGTGFGGLPVDVGGTLDGVVSEIALDGGVPRVAPLFAGGALEGAAPDVSLEGAGSSFDVAHLAGMTGGAGGTLDSMNILTSNAPAITATGTKQTLSVTTSFLTSICRAMDAAIAFATAA